MHILPDIHFSPVAYRKYSEMLSRILFFVQNIPEDTDKSILDFLFQQFPGFVECRVLPGKGTMAFVEYENEEQSGTVLSQLNGFEIEDDRRITIQYAKK